MSGYEYQEFPFKDEPPHVVQAMREEHERFRIELRTLGPHVVPITSMKARLKAAKERAEAEGPANPPEGEADTSSPA